MLNTFWYDPFCSCGGRAPLEYPRLRFSNCVGDNKYITREYAPIRHHYSITIHYIIDYYDNLKWLAHYLGHSCHCQCRVQHSAPCRTVQWHGAGGPPGSPGEVAGPGGIKTHTLNNNGLFFYTAYPNSTMCFHSSKHWAYIKIFTTREYNYTEAISEQIQIQIQSIWKGLLRIMAHPILSNFFW